MILYPEDTLSLRSTGCDYATVERVNRDTVYPLLAKLTETAFMRFFKVCTGSTAQGCTLQKFSDRVNNQIHPIIGCA